MAHLEAVQLLLVMASTQLYSPTATGHWGAHPLTEAMLTQADLVPGVVQRLLQHAIERQPLPPHAPVYTLAPGDRPSVLRLVRSAAGLPNISVQLHGHSSGANVWRINAQTAVAVQHAARASSLTGRSVSQQGSAKVSPPIAAWK